MAIIRQQKTIKRTRKEPRDLEHFRRMYAHLDTLNQGTHLYTPLKVNPLEAQKIGGFLLRIAGGKSEGTTIIAPLSSAIHTGEFAKGFFKIINPNIRVVFLKTPKSDFIARGGQQKPRRKFTFRIKNTLEHRRQLREMQRNLDENVKKSIKPSDKRLILLDDGPQHGRTEWILGRALKRTGNRNAELIPQSNYPIREFMQNVFHGTFVKNGIGLTEVGQKSWDGKMWGDWKNYYFQKSLPDLDKNYTPGAFEENQARELKIARRFAFNLGIATAKEMLRQQTVQR